MCDVDVASLENGRGMTTALLVWGMLSGAIGLGYFVYGKKQGALVPLFCGLGLMIFPYFMSNVYLLLIIGGVIAALPYFWRE
ncbi:MAG: hypothetical protein ACI9ZF_002606 [Bradyrhizobium sp.]|jgi:hypothetical protein